MKKRILSVLITLVMLIGLVTVMSISVSAAKGYLRDGTVRSGTVYSDKLREGDILRPGTKICAHEAGVEIHIRQEPGGGSVDEYKLGKNQTWPESSASYYNSAFYVDHVNESNRVICLIPIETADIIFDYNDGTGNSITKSWYTKVPMQHVMALYYASAPEVTRTGYTFVGWNTKADGTGTDFIPDSSEDFSVTGDTTLYAQWKPNKYAITFKNEDGSTLQSGNWDYDTTPSYTGATPTKAATAQYTYTFTGWSPAIATVTGDATYTAQFSSTVNKYTITWVVDGVTTTEEYDYGATPSFKGSTDKASDAQYTYTFADWDTTLATVTGNKTYTATYSKTPNTYSVTLNTNDGDIISGNVTAYTYGTGATLPIPSKTGYSFDGWYANAEFDGEVITEISADETGDKTFYAKWTAIPYDVSLQSGGAIPGGSFSTDFATATIGQTVTITVEPKLGYYVVSVYCDSTKLTADGDGKYRFTMPTRDVTISATFDFDFAAIAKELQELNDADAALQSAVTNGDSDLSNEIADLQTAITNAQNAINDLDNGYATDDQINALKSALEAADATMSDAIEALTIRVTSIESALGGIDLSQIATNKQEIADLTTELDAVEDTVDQLDNTFINNTELSTALGNLKAELDEADALLEKAIQDVQDNLDAAKKELADAIDALDEAMKKGDSDLAEEINGLNEALINAENALKQADETNNAELTEKIDEADALLEKAIQDVQDNLDAAKKELTDAIDALETAMENGDADLSDKIAALAKALAKAQEELENTIADNKAALEAKMAVANTLIKDSIKQVQKNLDTAKKQLETAISDGDTVLSGKIAELNEALATAQAALTAVDEANKAELISKIDAADATLDAAIKAVQKNLDDAKAELDKAIADGDTALDDMISALNEALATAKAALEATDSANKAELNAKIDDAYTSLNAAIKAVQKNLDEVKNALDEKDNELQTFIIIVCVISGVAFCGCGTIAVFYIIDKKKKL